MKISTYIKKTKGFLFITTVTIIVILLFNLLIGYRLIFRKGEKVQQLISNIEDESLKYSLENIIYSELKRVDKRINLGEFESGAEYIGYKEGSDRVWLGNSDSRESQSGYVLVSMRINRKNRFYTYKEGEFTDFKLTIKRELLLVKREEKIIGIEMKKIVSIEGSKDRIYLCPTVELYYDAGVSEPSDYSKEVLKDFEVGIEKGD